MSANAKIIRDYKKLSSLKDRRSALARVKRQAENKLARVERLLEELEDRLDAAENVVGIVDGVAICKSALGGHYIAYRGDIDVRGDVYRCADSQRYWAVKVEAIQEVSPEFLCTKLPSRAAALDLMMKKMAVRHEPDMSEKR